MLNETESDIHTGLRKLCEESYATAKSKGFHDKPRTFGDSCALIHTEISEAFEAFRNNESKRRVAEELADAMIRIADTAQDMGLFLADELIFKMQRNKKREQMHRGKKL